MEYPLKPLKHMVQVAWWIRHGIEAEQNAECMGRRVAWSRGTEAGKAEQRHMQNDAGSHEALLPYLKHWASYARNEGPMGWIAARYASQPDRRYTIQ